MADRPICIDGFCGRWGWGRAFRDAGYQVIGFDNNPRAGKYAEKMEFVCADIRDLEGTDFPPARAFVASPPCERFSTATNLSRRFGYNRNPEMGMELVRHTIRFAKENGSRYWCLENVQGAVRYISRELGAPRLRKHSYYLWGNFPGFILPSSNRLRKFHAPREGQQKYLWNPGMGSGSHRSAALRALIPYALARAVAEACL